MTLSCLRRAIRPEDRPPPSIRDALAGIGPDLLVAEARLVGAGAGRTHWVVPTDDGQGVCLLSFDDHGSGGGSITTFEALRSHGASGTTDIHRGRWRYALLIADGYQRARAGEVEVAVVDNLAAFDLADRERFVELTGPAGTLTYDLGPSDWDDFAAAQSR